MLPAGHRLRASSDFAAALRGPRGARAGSTLIVVHANQTDARAGQPPRVGFVVSKAVGTAVVRNRTKRRLRALMAARIRDVPAGTDVVVRANPVAAQADSSALGAELDRLLGRVLGRLGGARA
ncbi:ribonuclease P protein component [Phycicoccus sp. M110.8]|uniref:ribonuclease P protein component n=1 Tax=Phycicoccus sp. M110.8 TaxID=3075433 RepID=UPI0028FDA532|nr:ribonuclease P protein component [Phycicoccus sp. M110.8]MDU0313691.1 ribonuclease P protein component [Phycicoccus sp. M110.8]HET8767289.1 ribonuclease P protein component [Pedococcus sp.]